jgi:hypothetical protein
MTVDKIAEALDTVTISKAEYDELVKDQTFLKCLMGAGVDNWEGYDFAIETYQEDYPDEDYPDED